MEPPASILKWKFQLDNPTFLGWTVVTVYFVAAICCARAALKKSGDSRRSFSLVWWMMAAGLTFLGVNKQLNLQTLMIVIGRNAASAGEWYGQRRRVQLIFSAGFGVLVFGALAWLSWHFREFFKKNHFVLAGAVVLALFVVMRSATINHTDEFFRVDLKDEHWAWVLEIAGSILIAIGALRPTGGEYPE